MSQTPKPAGWAPKYARAFHHGAVARVYHLRPPYPGGLFTTLTELILDQPRTVLDLGCGPGDLARRIVDAADRVDAVDTDTRRAFAHLHDCAVPGVTEWRIRTSVQFPALESCAVVHMRAFSAQTRVPQAVMFLLTVIIVNFSGLPMHPQPWRGAVNST
jgi:SAM-dependent methyltransferase